MSADVRLLDIAYFEGRTSRNPIRRRSTWPDLVKLLRTHDTAATKDGMCFSPVAYPRGVTRGKAYVESVSCLALDFDHLTPERWVEIVCKLAPLASVAYTTYSHTDEAPRWRVVLPLVASVPAAQWPEVFARVRVWLPDADRQCGDCSRLYYLPSHPAGGAWETAANVEGEWLDVRELPEAPKPRPRKPIEAVTTAEADAALWKWVRKVEQASKGERNALLNRAAWWLGSLAAAGKVDEGSVQSWLLAAALACGLDERGAKATIASGLKAGRSKA